MSKFKNWVRMFHPLPNFPLRFRKYIMWNKNEDIDDDISKTRKEKRNEKLRREKRRTEKKKCYSM